MSHISIERSKVVVTHTQSWQHYDQLGNSVRASYLSLRVSHEGATCLLWVETAYTWEEKMNFTTSQAPALPFCTTLHILCSWQFLESLITQFLFLLLITVSPFSISPRVLLTSLPPSPTPTCRTSSFHPLLPIPTVPALVQLFIVAPLDYHNRLLVIAIALSLPPFSPLATAIR